MNLVCAIAYRIVAFILKMVQNYTIHLRRKNSNCPLREIDTEDPLDEDAKEASIPDLGTHMELQ